MFYEYEKFIEIQTQNNTAYPNMQSSLHIINCTNFWRKLLVNNLDWFHREVVRASSPPLAAETGTLIYDQ